MARSTSSLRLVGQVRARTLFLLWVARGTDIAATIRELIVGSWPLRFEPQELRDDVSLGDGGLGLDSIELVELLLVCEDHLGRTVSNELFERPPLTIERIAEYFAAA